MTGDVFLDLARVGPDGQPLRFEADGEVRLLGATIGGQLSCSGGRFTNTEGTAVDGEHMRVMGVFRWSKVVLSGGVDLRAAAVGMLEDDRGRVAPTRRWPSEGRGRWR